MTIVSTVLCVLTWCVHWCRRGSPTEKLWRCLNQLNQIDGTKHEEEEEEEEEYKEEDEEKREEEEEEEKEYKEED